MIAMRTSPFFFACLLSLAAAAAEIHVSPQGDYRNEGSADKPLQTLAAAQQAARPFVGKELGGLSPARDPALHGAGRR